MGLTLYLGIEKGNIACHKSEVRLEPYCERDASRVGFLEMRLFGEAKSISGHQTLQLMRRTYGVKGSVYIVTLPAFKSHNEIKNRCFLGRVEPFFFILESVGVLKEAIPSNQVKILLSSITPQSPAFLEGKGYIDIISVKSHVSNETKPFSSCRFSMITDQMGVENG
ncbi:hypothetical protein FXO37_00901 [Capsicum annuum]|nr:hypothetical protein FXO37_00901 [Capsicum annuum]